MLGWLATVFEAFTRTISTFITAWTAPIWRGSVIGPEPADALTIDPCLSLPHSRKINCNWIVSCWCFKLCLKMHRRFWRINLNDYWTFKCSYSIQHKNYLVPNQGFIHWQCRIWYPQRIRVIRVNKQTQILSLQSNLSKKQISNRSYWLILIMGLINFINAGIKYLICPLFWREIQCYTIGT